MSHRPHRTNAGRVASDSERDQRWHRFIVSALAVAWILSAVAGLLLLLSSRAGAQVQPTTVGEIKTIAVLLDFANDPATLTNAEVASALYDANNPNSFARWVQEISGGRAHVTGSVHGYYRAPFTYTSLSQLITDSTPFIIQQLDAVVDFSDLDFIFVFPTHTSCLGSARVPYSSAEGPFTINTTFMGLSSSSRPVLSFGAPPNFSWSSSSFGWAFTGACLLGEANALECGTQSYSHDPSQCVRQVRYFQQFDIRNPSSFARMLAAPFKEKLGWMGASNILRPTTSGLYTIRPLGQVTNEVQAIRIPRALCPAPSNFNECGGQTAGEYVIEYRAPVGFDAVLATPPSPSFPALVPPQGGSVLLYADSYYSGPQDPDYGGHNAGTHNDLFLLDMSPQTSVGDVAILNDFRSPELRVGSSWTTPEGITLTTVHADLTGATIQLTFPGQPTPTPSATSTITPTRSATATPSATATATRSPTATVVATTTATRTPTRTPTATSSFTPTAIPSRTATATPTGTPTRTPTSFSSATPTSTATRTRTPTVSPSTTPSPTPTASATPVVESSPTAMPTATATRRTFIRITPGWDFDYDGTADRVFHHDSSNKSSFSVSLSSGGMGAIINVPHQSFVLPGAIESSATKVIVAVTTEGKQLQWRIYNWSSGALLESFRFGRSQSSPVPGCDCDEDGETDPAVRLGKGPVHCRTKTLGVRSMRIAEARNVGCFSVKAKKL